MVRRYGLPAESFSLAVVGLKVDSEHEDSCCVVFEPADDQAAAAQAGIQASFIVDARQGVSKGARPDFIRVGEIPRNFKGAILVGDMKKAYAAHLAARGIHITAPNQR